MTFTTQSEILQSGTISFQFYLPDTATVTSSVYVESLGSLKFEFDIPTSTESPNSIGSKPGSIKLTLMTTKRDDELSEAFEELSGVDKYLAIMNFTEANSGSISGAMSFYFDKTAIEYDEEDKLLSVELTPIPLIYLDTANDGTVIDATINAYLNGDYDSDITNLPTLYTDSSGDVAVVAGQFIENVMELITKREELIFLSDNYIDTPPSSGIEWVIKEEAIATYTLMEMFGVLAAIEGDIYGTFFGENFFVGRTSTSAGLEVTIPYSSVENLSRLRFNVSEYREVSVTLDSDTATSVFNDYGEKTLNISFVSGALTSANILSGSSFSDNSPYPTELQVTAISNYDKSLGLQDRILAELDLLGFGIKPYSRIKFNTDAPSVFQGKLFGITEVEYDFVNYKTKANIYEIGTT